MCSAQYRIHAAATAVHAGLFEKAEPIYGRPCGYRTCRLERQSQRDGTDGVVCQRDWEAGLDSPAGYPGSAIKGASLRWQRGFFFSLVRSHLSVGFADSSPQGEPSHPMPPLEGRCRHRRRRGGAQKKRPPPGGGGQRLWDWRGWAAPGYEMSSYWISCKHIVPALVPEVGRIVSNTKNFFVLYAYFFPTAIS